MKDDDFSFSAEEYFSGVHSQEDYVKLKEKARAREKEKRENEREQRRSTTAQRQQQRELYELTMRRLEDEKAERERQQDKIENPRSPYADHLADLKDPRSHNHLNMSEGERKRRIAAYTRADKEWHKTESERIKAEAKKKKLDADPEVQEIRNFFERFKKARPDPEEVAVMGELEAYADAGAVKEFWETTWRVSDAAAERRSKELAEKKAAAQATQDEIHTMENELKNVNDKRQTAQQNLGEK